MLLTIHDANLQKVAFVDNSKQNTLNYYADTWVRSLPTGSSTFEFTVFKKAIKSDTALTRAYQYLNERAWVSFKYKGKSFIFNVMTVEEDEQTIKCYCENLNLELINEIANPYKATKAMSFAEYCEAMDLLYYTHLAIGINEVSSKKRTIEWQGQETKLARLLSLAKNFDAEIEFDTQLNADSTIKKFSINIYHENDDNHQGVGRIRNDIQLKYGKNIKSIRRKVDKTGIFNTIRPTGKRTVKNAAGEDVEEVVTIRGLDDWKKYNKDGICEFYQRNESLYAPLSMQLYPSTFSHGTAEDQWTRKDFTYDTDNPKELRTLAYKELKKHCYPAITYEVDGYVDVEIGDTVKIHDAGFAPLLTVQARVSEQHISFSNPASNKTVFSNFKALENQLSDGIQEAFERLFEQSKPYTIKLSTSNGIIFKNNSGESIITPTLYKGGKLITAGVTWRWSLNDKVTTGMTYTVRGKDVSNAITLTIGAYIGNDRVAVDELSLVNVSDGQIGAPGKSSHIHFAFSENPDGSGLSLIDNGQRYYGYYSDEQDSGSTDKTMYKWFDRWAKVEVGGRNLFLNSLFKRSLRERYSTYFLNDSQEQTQGQLTLSIDTNSKFRGANTLKIVSTYNGKVTNQKVTFITGGDTRLGTADEMKNKPVRFSFWAKSTINNTIFQARAGYRNAIQGVSLTTDWKFYDIELTKKENSNASNELILHVLTAATVWIAFPKVEVGTVSTDFSEAPEDVQRNIDSKADQGLTQEQLNALNEKAGIIQAELEAKASADTLDNWISAYQDFVKSNEKARAQAETDLISASQRVSNIAKDLGELSDRWNFIDTYMSSSNEGLVIGKNDGSSSMLFSPDGRISMFSAGVEVMYISQGVIHIENGIFSKTVQIGRFREEQYHLNPDMNVIRYVGGM